MPGTPGQPVGRGRPSPVAGAGDPSPLPAGFGLEAAPGLRILNGGRVLLGGSPIRLLALGAEAAAVVAGWRGGGVVSSRPAEQRLARRLVTATMFLPKPAGPSPLASEVTVVIPVRDRPGPLASLLASLEGLATVVVDDGSADPAASAQAAEAAGARFVALAENLGPAGARNAGMAHATTPLVAFIDSDCQATAGWLAPLLAHFADPMVAAVAPRVRPTGEGPGSWRDRYEAVRSPLDRGTRAGLVRPRSMIPFVPTAALVVRRSAVGDGGFDETLEGGEDVDFVWRLVEAGWDVRYVPTATVLHARTDGPGPWLLRRAFYGSTAGPLSRRHPDDLAPASTSAWTAAVAVALAGRRPGLALAVAAGSTALFARRLAPVLDRPWPLAATVVAEGTARSLVASASGLARAAGPLALAALVPRRTRAVAAFALAVPALVDWWATRPDLDPVRFTAAHIADDAAYGVGVWVGCIRSRTLRPLLPEIVWRTAGPRGPTRS